MSEQEPGPGPSSQQQAMTMQILWVALLVSVGMYAVVGTIAAPKNPTPPAPVETLQLFFVALAVAQTAFAMMVPKLLPKLPPFTLNILRWAVAESIGVLGLVFRFIGGSANMLYLFVGWSALLMLTLRPNQDIQK